MTGHLNRLSLKQTAHRAMATPPSRYIPSTKIMFVLAMTSRRLRREVH